MLRKLFLLLLTGTASAQVQSGGNVSLSGHASASANSTVASWQQATVPLLCQSAGCIYAYLSDTQMAAIYHLGAVGSSVNHVYTSPVTAGLPTNWAEVAAGSPIPVSTIANGSATLAPDGTTLLQVANAGTSVTLWYSASGGNWTLATGTSLTSGQAIILTTDSSVCWFTTDSGKIFKSTDTHCTAFNPVAMPSGTNAGIYGALGVGAATAPNTGNVYHLISKNVGDGNGQTLWGCGEGALFQVSETFLTGTATFTSGSASVTLSTANASLAPGMIFAADADTTAGTTILTYPGSGTALTMTQPATASGTVTYYAMMMYQSWIGEATASTTNGSTTMTLTAYHSWLDGLTGLTILNGSSGTGIPGSTTGSVSGRTITLSNAATATNTNQTYVVGTVGAVNSFGGFHANCTGFDVGATGVVAFRNNNAATTNINNLPTTGTRTVTSVASPSLSPNTNNLNVLHWLNAQTFFYLQNNGSGTTSRYYSTNNGAGWTNMDPLNGMDASCSLGTTYAVSGPTQATSGHAILSRCRSGQVLWVYWPL